MLCWPALKVVFTICAKPRLSEIRAAGSGWDAPGLTVGVDHTALSLPKRPRRQRQLKAGFFGRLWGGRGGGAFFEARFDKQHLTAELSRRVVLHRKS